MPVQIEKAVEHHMFSRASFFTDSQEAGSSMDALGQAVALQSRLNEAVEKEDFALAASLRDELNEAKACCRSPNCLHTNCSISSSCIPSCVPI